ncbi:hypothetical protein ACVHNB_32870 [Streptomyces sp. YJ-C3]
MNAFTVHAPMGDFSGESAGVSFRDGVGHVTDEAKEGRAAIEYFRRRGYTLTRDGAEKGEPAEPQRPEQGDEPFDPAEHDAPEVIAYLDAHADDEDEVARVLDAEKAGKARKTVLQKGAEA